MTIKQFTTRRTKESGNDKTDYLYTLQFDGNKVTLRTSWMKNGKESGGLVSTLNESDMGVIPKVFPNLSFECFQEDGVPTFNYKESRFHLVSNYQVTLNPIESLEL